MANKIIKAQAKGRNGEIDFDIKVTNNYIKNIWLIIIFKHHHKT